VIHRFESTVASPVDRGEEFGSRHATEIARTLDAYRHLFSARGADVDVPPTDVDRLGRRALERIEAFSPDLAEEIRGMAGGAGVPVSQLAALNARTEILAVIDRAAGRPGPDECSAVVSLGEPDAEPAAAQTWDWYADLADGWFEWTIPLPDGRRLVTVTEYGIVGKIGVNSTGVGLLFTMLHHRDDGADMGVPVHAIARRILEVADGVDAGLAMAAPARTSASTSLTLVGARRAGKRATTVELWPGGPGQVEPTPEGLLVHTNHFLSDPARAGDLTPYTTSDTRLRHEALRRRLDPLGGRAGMPEILAAMNDHEGGVCCHPDPSVDLEPYIATLATVILDVAAGSLTTHANGPCQVDGAQRLRAAGV
jgi:isopenicillin-N N-acyltransferase-like protein